MRLTARVLSASRSKALMLPEYDVLTEGDWPYCDSEEDDSDGGDYDSDSDCGDSELDEFIVDETDAAEDEG
jgi:hypothetical protein